jgi:hypothetical protein
MKRFIMTFSCLLHLLQQCGGTTWWQGPETTSGDVCRGVLYPGTIPPRPIDTTIEMQTSSHTRVHKYQSEISFLTFFLSWNWVSKFLVLSCLLASLYDLLVFEFRCIINRFSSMLQNYDFPHGFIVHVFVWMDTFVLLHCFVPELHIAYMSNYTCIVVVFFKNGKPIHSFILLFPNQYRYNISQKRKCWIDNESILFL